MSPAKILDMWLWKHCSIPELSWSGPGLSFYIILLIFENHPVSSYRRDAVAAIAAVDICRKNNSSKRKKGITAASIGK
jgi:hypothetical protein